MKNLNDMLNAYLGDTANGKEALLRTGLFSEQDIDVVIDVVDCVAKLDVPVTASFFSRTPADRFKETGRLARMLARGDDDPVPRFDAVSLSRQPRRVRRIYMQLLNELYEVAVALKVAGRYFGGQEHEAAKQWEQFCYYAHDHASQEERVRIAREQTALLRK